MKEQTIRDTCQCNCHVLQKNCEECLILHGIDALGNKNIENQVAMGLRRRATDDEIKERRNKISKIITNYPNTTQEELTDMFSVSLSTIQRDLDVIKDASFEWVDDLVRGGFLHKIRASSSRIDNFISRLQYRIDHEDLDPKTEAYLMQKINEFADSQIKETHIPFFQRLKQINDKLGTLPKNFTSIR